MSGVSEKQIQQLKAVKNQGTIHTQNSELFKLLLKSYAENQANENCTPNKLRADTNKKQTHEQTLDNCKKSQDSATLKNIKNLQESVTLDNCKKSQDSATLKNIKNLQESVKKVITKSDHLKEKTILVSGSGDAKVTSSEREGKENYNLFEIQKPYGVTECIRANSCDSSVGKHVAVVNSDSVDSVEAAHKGYLQVQVKENTVSINNLVWKSETLEQDQSLLSDIAESDCETLDSSISELATLRSPSRNSLNAGFEGGSSLPSSPVHPLQAGSDGVNENSKADRQSDNITPVGITRTAVETPCYKSVRQHNKTPFVIPLTERQDQSVKEVGWNTVSASKNIDQFPSVNSVTNSPVQPLSAVNSQKHRDRENNTTNSKTTVVQDGGYILTNENSADSHTIDNLLPAETETLLQVSHAESSVTNIPVFTKASREILEPRKSQINLAYSKLSPRLSSSSSQYVSATQSKVLHKYVTDTSVYLEDILQSRTNVPYHSQRLKSLGTTEERSGKVITFNNSLDTKDETEICPDSLDFDKDSLEISEADSKKNQSGCFFDSRDQNQGKTTDQSHQDSEKGLRTCLKGGLSNNNNLNENNHDGAKSSDRETDESLVIVASGESLVHSVDLQNKILVVDKENPKLTLQKLANVRQSTQDNEAQDVSSVEKQEQHFTASLTYSEGTDQRERSVTFVIKTNRNNQGASISAPGGSSSFLQHTIDPLQAAGSATTKRATSSVKMIYIESPVFSKEDEEVYRFVSSRLEDNKEDFMDTYRELDMAALQEQEKYELGMVNQKHVKYTDMDGRYEDRSNQGLHGVEDSKVSPAYNHKHPLGRPNQAPQSGYNAGLLEEVPDGANQYEKDPRSRRDYQQHIQQAYSNHPASQQYPQQLHGGSVGYQRQSYGNTHAPPQASSSQQDTSKVPNQQRHLDQTLGPQAQFRSPQSLLNQQGVVSQQGLGGKIIQHQHFPPQQHPAHIFQQEPHIDQQEQQSSKPPVRGLSLPTGPSYDPVDEEDLKNETSYQQGLLMRVEDGNRRAQQAANLQLPMNANRSRHHFDDAQDFVEDSLDYNTNDQTARSFGGGFVHDSLNMYDIPQQQLQQPLSHLRNPPSLPPNFANYSSGNFRNSRLDNVNFDSEDYSDQVGIRQQRVNPQIRPRFYYAQVDQHQDSLTSGELFEDDPNTGRSDAVAAYDVSQRYEDRQDEDEEPMEAVQPKPPKYDYVTNNKENLGKQNPKSYTRIHETNKEEKDRLQDIFVHPKPKSKGSIMKKNNQGQSQPRSQFNDYQPAIENYEEMTPAEQVWAQRSASLAKKFDGNNNRGRRRGPGNLHKFNSDSSLNQTYNPHGRQTFQTSPQQRQPNQSLQQQQQPAPDNRAFITEMPTPLTDGSSHNQLPNHTTQHQAEVMLQPITQQIHTQDGQRISVDVNLKLISPPSLIDGFQYQPQLYQNPPQPQLYQYPPQPQQYQPPQYYSSGQGRQYPATVASCDEGGGEGVRLGVPALEYQSQDYDSDNNEYRHGSPRERYSADQVLVMQSRTELNPYGKIPPIGRSQGIEHPSSAPVQDQAGSYMEMYMRQKVKEAEHPWYRVYGLQDYRRMQKEVRLGTLGPDLDNDAVREKREKMARQTDYAKVVMEKNRNVLANRKPPAFPRPKEDNDIISRRRLAMEYAKSVPKPTVKVQPNEFNNYELGAEKSPIAKHHKHDPLLGGLKNGSPRQAQKKEKEMDILDLDKLRQRYEEDKMNEAIIRRNVHSSNRESYY